MNQFLSYGVWHPAFNAPKIVTKPSKRLKADSLKVKTLKEENVIIFDIYN